MANRAAKILIPSLLAGLVVCVVMALVVWILNPPADVGRATPSGSPAAASAVKPASLASSAPVASGNAQAGDVFAVEQARIALYERVGPAVVSIDTTNQGQDDQLDLETLQMAQGSGFLVDDQGHIATNNHVVADARSIYVTFSNGHQVKAELTGRDEDTDLAVIKVDPKEIAGAAPLTFADSRQIKVGQDTIAIGNPFGLQNTMTLGIVSAVEGRSLPSRTSASGGSFRISRIIQTDAAINPGNSGGPLLNSKGEVIGINTAIRVGDDSSAPSFAGVGYAVPSNTIKIVVEDLISTGAHKSAYLGVSMVSITPQLAETFDLPVIQGVLISSVSPGGPAENAGLRIGSTSKDFGGEPLMIDSDIIVAFNGELIDSSDDLIAQINDSRVGDTVILTIQRGSEKLDVDVTLMERPK